MLSSDGLVLAHAGVKASLVFGTGPVLESEVVANSSAEDSGITFLFNFLSFGAPVLGHAGVEACLEFGTSSVLEFEVIASSGAEEGGTTAQAEGMGAHSKAGNEDENSTASFHFFRWYFNGNKLFI